MYSAYLAEDADGRADIEQTLELLAAKHLGQNYEPDRSPFPPPSKEFATSGDVSVGNVTYSERELYPFALRSARLTEHVLVAGRSGSGKTNLTFVLMLGIMDRSIKVLALDWKRGYRDLLAVRRDLHIYTIGRDVSPFRFNPLIPPPGCEPQVWIKLIVDVIASAYLGGEGVISLLVAGMDRLYREAGVFDRTQTSWPTIEDLLAWLRTVKLKGRAAMWQASAERILLAMTYGEFAGVLNTQDNSHIRELLDHNVILEMDGLSSSSDRTMFSEALTLYLYRYRLAQGPRQQLTNAIIIEEAHNLLLAKQAGARESVLESSIRMIRQYGIGYVFVDQSASLLSKVAFANSYATFALSQKLSADVRAMSSAMNLTDEQKAALSTLPIGSAVVRLADEHPEPFLVKVPRCPIREGSVSDRQIRERMSGCHSDSTPNRIRGAKPEVIPAIPLQDRKEKPIRESVESLPPSPRESATSAADTVP
ncbi:MAG: ATP-binding protein, partial [Phycisphaerae bacterium]